VVEVPNGEEAVKKAIEIKPDLILMDVRMPKMTAMRLAGRSRSKKAPKISRGLSVGQRTGSRNQRGLGTGRG